MTSHSEDDGVSKTKHDVVLDLRLKEYKDIVVKFLKDGRYNTKSQTGKAILEEMKNSLRRTGGRILKRYGNGYIEVDDKTALTTICQGVKKTSETEKLPVDNRTADETPAQKSSRAQSTTRSQSQEESPSDKTPTKPHFSEFERGELKDYFGGEFVVESLLAVMCMRWHKFVHSDPSLRSYQQVASFQTFSYIKT